MFKFLFYNFFYGNFIFIIWESCEWQKPAKHGLDSAEDWRGEGEHLWQLCWWQHGNGVWVSMSGRNCQLTVWGHRAWGWWQSIRSREPETLALCHGLCYAWNRGFWCVEVESDCKDLVFAMEVENSYRFYSNLREIKSWIRRDWDVVFIGSREIVTKLRIGWPERGIDSRTLMLLWSRRLLLIHYKSAIKILVP